MQIKNYQCTQFGGLKNKNIELQEGLNVILGPNEAGKSTIVEGIYSTLFKQHKLSKRTSADVDFANRFMPKPSGDFIDGNLTIQLDSAQYHISKNWGTSSYTKMTLPTGSIIQDVEEVDKNLRSLLSFGEKTYGNIIFSKQQDLKRAISLILEEGTSDLSTVLRKVVMELDGLSVDKLKESINDEYERLFSKWNPTLDRPENNTRLKRGLGEIIKKYYELEDKQTDITRGKSIEAQINKVTIELKELEERKAQTKEQIEKLSKIEFDVNQRAAIQPKIEHLKEKESTLKEVFNQWPEHKAKLNVLNTEIEQMQTEIKNLSEQLVNAQKAKEKQKLEALVEKIEKTKSAMETFSQQLADIPKVTREDIKTLEILRTTIGTIETAINAGKMQGRILENSASIWITKDFDERQQYQGSTNFFANGYMKIELDDKVVLEIQSGEFDFQDLKNKLVTAKEEMQTRLSNLNLQTIEEGKLNFEKQEKLTREIEGLNRQLSLYLDGQSYEELKAKLEELRNIKVLMDVEEIQTTIDLKRKGEQQALAQQYHIKSKLTQWEETYKDHDAILELLFEVKTENKGLNSQLEKLAPLPTEFATPQAFSEKLVALRREMQYCQEQYEKIKDHYYQLERELPEVSTEEMVQELKVIKSDLMRLKNRGKNLLKVKEVFERKLEEMDKNSFEPLVNAFGKYLAVLTINQYSTVDIDDSFNMDIQKGNVSMPLDLLSAGTKDCVALALRLAITEVLYGERSGILVLDDCLVDLDPQRKSKAVELIKQFAQNNQVIFTTCSPQTAKELGGNTIQLS